ncbi:MAG: shikimate kinase [Nitrospirota bacterium]|nr:shikimate kinase [Nitrospirota bacterium]
MWSGKNIVLTGFMGTGKSSVGRRLARKLGLKFVDTDDLITEQAGISIRAIFEEYGEEKFREVERKVVRKVSGETGLVIATGGGVVLNPDNIEDLRRNGIIICLTASPEKIMERTAGKDNRPLLNTEDRGKKVREMLEYRRPFYAKADVSVDTSSMDLQRVTAMILKHIRQTSGK